MFRFDSWPPKAEETTFTPHSIEVIETEPDDRVHELGQHIGDLLASYYMSLGEVVDLANHAIAKADISKANKTSALLHGIIDGGLAAEQRRMETLVRLRTEQPA
jgi:hypothetical protein